MAEKDKDGRIKLLTTHSRQDVRDRRAPLRALVLPCPCREDAFTEDADIAPQFAAINNAAEEGRNEQG